MNKKQISNIIDRPIFSDLPKQDLLVNEMDYLKNRFTKNNVITSEGLIDLIYSSYKLGFCKAYLSMGKEIPGTERKENNG